MNTTFNIAPGIGGLTPYVPGKPVSELERELDIYDSVKLASNENPLGPSPLVTEALKDELHELSRYPDGGGFALRGRLSERHLIGDERITLGNGSNDVLDMIARVFLWPGREAVMSEHAFAVYPISSQAVGATIRVAPARDYGHDLAAMRALVGEDTGVVFIANPNNPTGTWLRRGELRDFLDDLPAHVVAVVDEAYTEYVDEPDYPDASEWLDELPNLIVTRTFSKAWGLAGLRVGYALSSLEIADLLNRVRQPFNVNLLAQLAAGFALDDEAHMREGVSFNACGMGQIVSGVHALGLDYIPSVGNFLCIDVGRDAAEVDQALLREGVITRPVANYGLPRHLRVSIGMPEENARFLEALEKVLST